MLCRTQESVRLGLEVLDADPLVGSEDAPGERVHVRVVARIVVSHQLPEPAIVALIRRLPRLAVTQVRVGLRHLAQPAENEIGLDRHRLLTPQGAVVVEHGNTFFDGHLIGHRPLHELQDAVSRSTWIPPVKDPGLDTHRRDCRSARDYSRAIIAAASRSRST